VFVDWTLLTNPKILTWSLFPPILITLLSLLLTLPIFILIADCPIFKTSLIESMLSHFNLPKIDSVIKGSFLIKNLSFKFTIVVFFKVLISLVWFERVLLILFIFVVLVKSYDLQFETSYNKFVILLSSTTNFELIVAISLVFVVILFLLTLLSASNTDTLDWRVETLFLVVVLSVFKELISKLFVLTFVCKFDIFNSSAVCLVLFVPIYVVKLDWTVVLSLFYLVVKLFKAVFNEL